MLLRSRLRRWAFVGWIVCGLLAFLYVATAAYEVSWGKLRQNGHMWSFSVGAGRVAAGWEDIRQSHTDYLWFPDGWEIRQNSKLLLDPIEALCWIPDINWNAGQKSVEIPLWLPLLVCTALTLTASLLSRRPHVGHCPQCDYDLTGNLSGVCPECGRSTDAADLSTFSRLQSTGWPPLICAGFGLCIFCGALLVSSPARIQPGAAAVAMLTFAGLFSAGVLVGCVQALRAPPARVRARWAVHVGAVLCSVVVLGGLVWVLSISAAMRAG